MTAYKTFLVLGSTAALWLMACSSSTAIGGKNEAARPGVRVYVLDGGSTRIADKTLFGDEYAGTGSIELEVRCFLIVHPRGILMWDSGHSDAMLAEVGTGHEGYQITVDKGVLSQMRTLGLTPDKVDLLAASHWHFDHTGNFNLFASDPSDSNRDATVVIGQRDEYELAFSDLAAGTFGMEPGTYAGLAENPTDLFIGDRDVFGDGQIRILRVGGHTIGSQVLFVDLEQYGPILLSGDLYHFAEQREHRRVPPFNHDLAETIAGMERVESFLEENPDTELWITHDSMQMSALKLSPSFYE